MKTWVRELKQYAEPDIVLAIAGNKCDLDDLREIQFKGCNYHCLSVVFDSFFIFLYIHLMHKALVDGVLLTLSSSKLVGHVWRDLNLHIPPQSPFDFVMCFVNYLTYNAIVLKLCIVSLYTGTLSFHWMCCSNVSVVCSVLKWYFCCLLALNCISNVFCYEVVVLLVLVVLLLFCPRLLSSVVVLFFRSENVVICSNVVFLLSSADAMDYAEMQRAIFVETSAKTAVNIGALFVEISKDM